MTLHFTPTDNSIVSFRDKSGNEMMARHIEVRDDEHGGESVYCTAISRKDDPEHALLVSDAKTESLFGDSVPRPEKLQMPDKRPEIWFED